MESVGSKSPGTYAHAARRRATLGVLVVALLFCALTVAGALWREVLCDDAFITFRYVSNARDGHGLVWNAPPFRPVEGYTSLSWALVLWACWSWFDWLPTHSANWLSIACGVGLVLVTANAAPRMRDRDGARAGPLLVALVLLAVVGNHTFLQWCTSGLETALFNLLFVSWVVAPFGWSGAASTRSLAGWTALAALTALTRPDGLLPCAATGFVLLVLLLRRHIPARAFVIAAAPSLLVVAQLAWRLSFYGEWLPNTYYAKVTAPWPEAGWRYLLCFVAEHGTWLLVPAGAIALLRHRAPTRPAGSAGSTTARPPRLARAAVVATVAAHVGYYVLRVGGDHFAFRVLSHLVPLTALTVAALAMRCGRATSCAALLALSLASAVGWLRPALTDQRVPPAFDALADHVPEWAAPLARWHDRHRLWMHLQMVCFDFHPSERLERTLALVPERKRRAPAGDDVCVATATACGLIGWTMPDIAILDTLGLNDWVTARTPIAEGGQSPIPPEAIAAVLQGADTNGDGAIARGELVAAATALTRREEHARALTDLLLKLFAVDDPDALAPDEATAVAPFFGGMRLMAHERSAPAEYVDAFDVNVAFAGPEVTIRERARPLTADDVRKIEARWRARVAR